MLAAVNTKAHCDVYDPIVGDLVPDLHQLLAYINVEPTIGIVYFYSEEVSLALSAEDKLNSLRLPLRPRYALTITGTPAPTGMSLLMTCT